MKQSKALRVLGMTTSLVCVLPLVGWTQGSNVKTSVEGCSLSADGSLQTGCSNPAPSTVVVMPAGANTEPAQVVEIGAEGFVITIDAPTPGQPRGTLAGQGAVVDGTRDVDRLLSTAGVQVTFDGLGAKPTLAVSTADLARTYRAGESVEFRAAANYGAWITRAEIVISRAGVPSDIMAVVPISPNGSARWVMPQGSADTADMQYTLRVYDGQGRWDETIPLPISRSTPMDGPKLDGSVVTPGEGQDMAARRRIPARGGMVTVTSDNLAPGAAVRVLGETAYADANGRLSVQRILPPGVHQVQVGVGSNVINRSVEVPESDWFYVGLVNVTAQHDIRGGDTKVLGRLAGYAKGATANGVTYTMSLDTRERELKDIFRDLGEKNPDAVIRRIRGEDVYPTFGDDSTSSNDAPTSGKFYFRAERDNNYVMWGDNRVTLGGSALSRTDRTLYGLSSHWESQDQTSFGEARASVSGFAAEPDRLTQRDVMRGVGTSTYFLSRRDIMPGTETVLVQLRDPVTGRVVKTTRLAPGADYRFDAFQGVIHLTRPLQASAGGTNGLTGDRLFGDYDVELVTQYDYVPTSGDVSGMSAGLRGEAWVTDQLRLGASAQRETNGVSDTQLVSADALWRHSDKTFVTLSYGKSEGPGFGRRVSDNGGMDIVTEASTGAVGTSAAAYAVELQADLGELSNDALQGSLSAHVDHKEAGFVSADYNISTTQDARGVALSVEASERLEMHFIADQFEDANGKKRNDYVLGVDADLNDTLALTAEYARTERTDPLGAVSANGTRDELGVRLTWQRDEDLSVWAFGRKTLRTTGGLGENDRYGVGASARVSDSLAVDGEVSGGTSGTAADLGVVYQPNAGSTYRLGYRLDASRRTQSGGRNMGQVVLGSSTRMNESLRVTGETRFDLGDDRGTTTSAYGVTYTPTDQWAFDASMTYGQSPVGATDVSTRRGASIGAHYSEGSAFKAGVSLEYMNENSTDDRRDRTTYGLSGYTHYAMNDDWRLLANLDAVVSDHDATSLRDGVYAEANLGFAYRPVENERFNMLARYRYIHDMPGPDQVNRDGAKDGPAQRSHILSVDAEYDLDQLWTIGGKLGYRFGSISARGSDVWTDNRTALAVLRADYHLVHNWDLMGEVRMLNALSAGVIETSALAGAWRHFGNNLKVGVGYQWGDVSDDLGNIEGGREGVFLNITGKF